MRASKVIPVLVLLASPLLQAQEEALGEMVAKALQNPTDEIALDHALWGLRERYDPRAIPAFQELFLKLTMKWYRQRLALELMKLGEKDQMYFDELAKYAHEAIITTAPFPIELDEQGNEKKGQYTPAFIGWCETNKLSLNDCLELVLGYPVDVALLAAAKDRRSIPLLRQGLSVTNYVTVQAALQGLASLNDTDSIPLIAASLRQFPPRIAQPIAAVLAEFDDPRVPPLLDRFVTDPKWRQEIEERIHKRKAQ